MEKECVIIAEHLKYSFDDITDDILNHIPIIMMVEDEEGYWCGKWMTEENFDELNADFWNRKYILYPYLFVNAKVYENKSKVSIPAGKFVYQRIRKMLN